MNGPVENRDLYLDFYRGLAAISVIFIHTAFHSGTSYVPEWFRNISLLLDVPFFFFLSGWSMRIINEKNNSHHIKKIFNSIWNIWIKWIHFVFCILIGSILLQITLNKTFVSNPNQIFKAICLVDCDFNYLSSVASSFWFIPIFICITIIGGVWIEQLKYFSLKEKILSLLLCIIGVIYCSYKQTMFFLSSYIWFYLFFYLLGFLLYGKKIKKILYGIYLLIIIIILWWGISYIFSIPFYDLQSMKFPPRFMYLVASMISVIIAIILNGRINKIANNTLIRHIGKNAIWYYFAQGVGATTLYYIQDFLNIFWFPKLIILWIINLTITIIISELLRIVYIALSKIIKKCTEKIYCKI